jgi:hypothetical protein
LFGKRRLFSVLFLKIEIFSGIERQKSNYQGWRLSQPTRHDPFVKKKTDAQESKTNEIGVPKSEFKPIRH